MVSRNFKSSQQSPQEKFYRTRNSILMPAGPEADVELSQ